MLFPQHIESLIASLRGVPSSKQSQSMSKLTCPIDGLIDKILNDSQIGQTPFVEIIMKNWRSVVGEKFAARCSPERVIKNTKLVIVVENATLRSELEFNKRTILKRLNSLNGCQHFQEIIFRSI